MHPKNERTFVIIKPDGIQRSLVGEIIKRFERAGYKLCAAKLTVPTEDQCWSHYNKDDAWFLKKGTNIAEARKAKGLSVDKDPMEYGKDIIRGAVNYMTAGPVLCMVWEGNQAVAVIKKMVGGTEPTTSDVGTIRGDFSLDSYHISDMDARGSVRNLIHCTDDVNEYEREAMIWFKPEEIISYKHVQEAILYDVNLDGILD
jgi:nucleoside-diphosphate kinase